MTSSAPTFEETREEVDWQLVEEIGGQHLVSELRRYEVTRVINPVAWSQWQAGENPGRALEWFEANPDIGSIWMYGEGGSYDFHDPVLGEDVFITNGTLNLFEEYSDQYIRRKWQATTVPCPLPTSSVTAVEITNQTQTQTTESIEATESIETREAVDDRKRSFEEVDHVDEEVDLADTFPHKRQRSDSSGEDEEGDNEGDDEEMASSFAQSLEVPLAPKIVPRVEWGQLTFFSLQGFPCIAPTQVFALLKQPRGPITCELLSGHERLEYDQNMPLCEAFSELVAKGPFVLPADPQAVTALTRIKLQKRWGQIHFGTVDRLPIFMAHNGFALLKQYLADDTVPPLRIIDIAADRDLRKNLIWTAFRTLVRVQRRLEGWSQKRGVPTSYDSSVILDTLPWCEDAPGACFGLETLDVFSGVDTNRDEE